MAGHGIHLRPGEIAAAFDTEDLRRRFPPSLTVSQLAELLGRSPKTIYFWIERGRLNGAFRKRGKAHLLWRDRAIELIFNGPEWEGNDQ